MKFTSLALLALVGGVSAGKPQLSVRTSIEIDTDTIFFMIPYDDRTHGDFLIVTLRLMFCVSRFQSVMDNSVA
jgi:hypothetical protein